MTINQIILKEQLKMSGPSVDFGCIFFYSNHDLLLIMNMIEKIVKTLYHDHVQYILFGCNVISEELNTLLFKSVQKFIRQTCRFNNYYPQP